jgi:hypothetical protein
MPFAPYLEPSFSNLDSRHDAAAGGSGEFALRLQE